MRKLVYASILTVMMCSAAFGASSVELEKMSMFISYFTELRCFNINADTISNEELIHFGVLYNDVNHYSRIQYCPDKYCPYGYALMHKKYLVESIRRLFARKITHTSTENEYFDGKGDGDSVLLAEVQLVSA